MGLRQNKDQNIISKILIILKMNEKLTFHLRFCKIIIASGSECKKYFLERKEDSLDGIK